MNADEKRNKKVQLWLSQSEYDTLKTASQKTNCRNLSEYLRCCVFQRPVISSYRNTSADDAMAVMGKLLKTLYCIADRQDLAVERLDKLWRFEEHRRWRSKYKKDMEKLWDVVGRIEKDVEKMTK